MVAPRHLSSSPSRDSLLGPWVWLVCVLLFCLPPMALAETGEFLVVQMDVTPQRLRLEITAEYGENSPIKDEEAAREAIRKSLLVQLGVKIRQLWQLAPLKFEKRTAWDSVSSELFPTVENAQLQLITGVWQWYPTEDKLKLHVPQEPQQDVLLWTPDKDLPGGKPKWMMLVAGDTTPEILVRDGRIRWDLIIRIGFVVLVLLGWSLMKMQKRGLKKRPSRVESRRPGR